MGYIPTMFHGPAASPTSVTFYIGSSPYMADESVPQFAALLDELKKPDPDTDLLIRFTEPAQAIAQAVEAATLADYLPKGVVSVTRSTVSYNGEVLTGVLVERILAQLAEGFDIMPMVRFLENLYQNPAEYAREELYLWLENSDLPITEDGCFLAYKKVNDNFTSCHDSRTKNDVGTVVSMPRYEVDTVRAHTCSTGLHFCSKGYLGSFGGAKIVLLKVNPADVVSIPSDYSNSKGRAWKYEVLSVVNGAETWEAVAAPQGGAVDRFNVNYINRMGIETLRAMASKAGLKGAWRGFTVADLKAFLISQL